MKPKINLSKKKIAKIPLSQECKSIILGTILGDGSLKKYGNYANARLTIKHSVMQRDYMDWLVSKLKEIATPKSYFEIEASGFSKENKLVFQSCAISQITEIWELTGKNNKAIYRSWLNHMDALSLAVWWFDDGSLMGNGRQGVFCTDNFDKEYCQILAKYLQVVWGVESKVRKKSKKKYKEGRENLDYRLFLGIESLRKLLIIILPYAFTPFMVKKCLLIYKDIDFQKRWISQMKSLLSKKGLEALQQLVLVTQQEYES